VTRPPLQVLQSEWQQYLLWRWYVGLHDRQLLLSPPLHVLHSVLHSRHVLLALKYFPPATSHEVHWFGYAPLQVLQSEWQQ
jgi:hypothetical protein